MATRWTDDHCHLGWDGDGSATSADQWEAHVKELAEMFAAENAPTN